jgi:hypothetical protein
VATPDTSLHVSGGAVDIGPSRATAWLSRHGAAYGLCRIYRNEPWHYELRREAIEDGCPSMYADPSSRWGNASAAPRAVRRPARGATTAAGAPTVRALHGGAAIPQVRVGGATPPAGMHRRPNAAGVPPRAAKHDPRMQR